MLLVLVPKADSTSSLLLKLMQTVVLIDVAVPTRNPLLLKAVSPKDCSFVKMISYFPSILMRTEP
jgi:hypothetical protein